MSDPRKKRRLRAVASAAAAGLVVTLAQVPNVTASAADTSPAAQDDGLLSQAEASEQAARTGQETEATELASPTTRIVALPDGQGFRAEVTALPSRVLDSDGTWKPVDTTLIRDEDGQIVPTRPAVEMAFSGGGDVPLARIADGDRSLALSWPGGDLPEPELTGSAALYREVLPGVDVVAQAGVTGFSTFVIVASKEAAENPAVRQLALDVAADGIQVKNSATGGLTAKDGTETVFDGSQPTGWDSEGATDTSAPGFTAEEKAVDAPLTPPTKAEPIVLPMDASNSEISLAVPQSVLSDPATVWPLVLDPSVTRSGTDYGGWTMVWSNGITKYNDATESARVGYDGWSGQDKKSRSYFKMDIPLGTLTAANVLAINSATFTHRQFHSPGNVCDDPHYGAAVRVYRTENFSSSTTWSNQPAVIGSLLDSDDYGHGNESQCTGYDEQSFNVTTGLKNAVAEGKEAITFRMSSADETDKYGWRKYDNTGTTSPKLTINYTIEPDQPTASALTITGSKTTAAGTWTKDATPEFKVTGLNDDNGGWVYGVFSVYDTAVSTTTPIWTKIDTGGNSPRTFTATYNGPALSQGKTYKLRAWAAADADATYRSAPRDLTFGVDSVVPNAPSAAPTPVPDDHSIKLTWPAASGTGSTVVEYQITSPTVANISSVTGNPAATTKTITGLTNGTAYTFNVKTVDAAGNVSTTAASVTATPLAIPAVDLTPLVALPTGSVAPLSYDSTAPVQPVLTMSNLGSSVYPRAELWRTTDNTQVWTASSSGPTAGPWSATLPKLDLDTPYRLQTWTSNDAADTVRSQTVNTSFTTLGLGGTLETTYGTTGPYGTGVHKRFDCDTSDTSRPASDTFYNTPPETEGQNLDAQDVMIDSCDVWYPTTLTATNPSPAMPTGGYPIITFGVGSNGDPATYAPLLGHLASWGFVIVVTEDGNTGEGDTISRALTWLRKRATVNAATASLSGGSINFYQRLNTTKVGAIGHSQGSTGVINAMAHRNTAGVAPITTTIAVEQPAQIFCNTLPPGAPCVNNYGIPTGSVFYITGARDLAAPPIDEDEHAGPTPDYPGEEDGEEKSVRDFYEHTYVADKAWGTLRFADHNDVADGHECLPTKFCTLGSKQYFGYTTAWMMDRLRGDTSARSIFVKTSNPTGEMFRNLNWEPTLSNSTIGAAS